MFRLKVVILLLLLVLVVNFNNYDIERKEFDVLYGPCRSVVEFARQPITVNKKELFFFSVRFVESTEI